MRPTGAIVLLTLGLGSNLSAEPYRWSQPGPALIAPSDRVEGKFVQGASIQGALVDLRYGQASIDVEGTGNIFEWSDKTVFTLDGEPIAPEALADMVKNGQSLKVAVRWNPESGMMGWCDAVSGRVRPAIDLRLDPWISVHRPGQDLTIRIPAKEAERLKLRRPRLQAPGMVHDLQFVKAGAQWLAKFPLLQGWNWEEMPLHVRDGDRVFRGRSLSVSSSGPSIATTGPHIASAKLETIPGWIDLGGNLDFFDPSTVRFKTSTGLKLGEIETRSARVDFLLQAIGPGLYWIEAEVGDTLGRRVKSRWQLQVTP